MVVAQLGAVVEQQVASKLGVVEVELSQLRTELERTSNYISHADVEGAAEALRWQLAVHEDLYSREVEELRDLLTSSQQGGRGGDSSGPSSSSVPAVAPAMGVSAIDSVVFDDIAELRGEAAAVSPHVSHGHRRVFQTLSLSLVQTFLSPRVLYRFDSLMCDDGCFRDRFVRLSQRRKVSSLR